MTYLIIDTNVCLHFTAIDEYPWRVHPLISDNDDITVVITHQLIEELDKKKYSGKNHLKERAIRTLKLIECSHEKKLKNGCRLIIYNKSISKDYIESLVLDISDADDKMIAAILKFREESEDSRILFVTNDLGPRLKAMKFNIKCLVPDNNHQLTNPVSETEKLLKQSRLENERLKNRIPKLSVAFSDGGKLIRCMLSDKSINPSEFIDFKMSEIREKNIPYKLKSELDKEQSLKETKKRDKGKPEAIIDFSNAIKNLQQNRFRIDEKTKEKYNAELNNYFYLYRNYLNELYDYNRCKALTIEIDLELINEGTTPAEDIDIYFHFPDGFELYDESTFPSEPVPPKVPTKPRSMLDYTILPYPLLGMSPVYSTQEKILPNVSYPKIKKSNSYDVEFYVKYLKHNQTASLNKLLLMFEDYASIINFNVKYELKCSNIPKTVTGTLNFIVENVEANK